MEQKTEVEKDAELVVKGEEEDRQNSKGGVHSSKRHGDVKRSEGDASGSGRRRRRKRGPTL